MDGAQCTINCWTMDCDSFPVHQPPFPFSALLPAICPLFATLCHFLQLSAFLLTKLKIIYDTIIFLSLSFQSHLQDTTKIEHQCIHIQVPNLYVLTCFNIIMPEASQAMTIVAFSVLSQPLLCLHRPISKQRSLQHFKLCAEPYPSCAHHFSS